MTDWDRVLVAARDHGYRGPLPPSPELVTDDLASAMAPALWDAAAAKAGRQLNEYTGIAVGASEFVRWCWEGRVQV